MKYEADYSPRCRQESQIFQDFNSDKAGKIKILIADTLEDPMEGLGKPERLKHLGAMYARAMRIKRIVWFAKSSNREYVLSAAETTTKTINH
jgi:Txe/YoeB family toxin of Txe-Axe toxin-antitoxin module